MKIPFIDFSLQNKKFLDKGKNALERVFLNENLIDGDSVDRLKVELANQYKIKRVITCGNGTDALELALQGLEIKEGDEVIIPALSWSSNLTSVLRVGATPIVADVHPDYHTISTTSVEKYINKRTKAVVAVHLHGLPAFCSELKEFCGKHDVFLIEDASQAHMAMIGRSPVGQFGDVATMSFYPTKNLGAFGDGGALMTNNETLADRIQSLSRVDFNELGLSFAPRNSRLDTLQAAFLLERLSMVNEGTAKRRRIARLYNNAFSNFNVTTPKLPNSFKHVFHHYVILTEIREKLRNHLSDQGIGTEVHYPKTLKQIGKAYGIKGEDKVAASISDRCLSLPNYPEMTDEQVEYVIQSVRSFVLKHG